MKALIALLLLLFSGPAIAQSWQVPLNTIPVGKGPGKTGFGNVANTGSGTLCLLNTAPPTFGACSGSLPSLASGRIFVGSAGGVATAVVLSGDCTLIAAGAITCLKTNGTSFTSAATTNIGTSGATIPLLSTTNTWTLAQTFTAAPIFTDASGSRTALGLGTIATQNANNVAITGGAYNGTIGATTPSTIIGTTGSFSSSVTSATTHTLDNGSVSAAWQLNGSGDPILNVVSNKGLEFRTNNTTRSFITAAGNFGIGTITADELLTVSKSQNLGTYVKTINATAGTIAAAGFQSINDGGARTETGTTSSAFTPLGAILANSGYVFSNSTAGLSLISGDAAGTIKLATNNTERIRLDSSGNLGIGTTSPAAQLHTTSTVRFAGISGVGTSGCLGNDTSGNITGGNPCTGTGFPSGGVKGDIAYYSAASTGAATKASDANIVIQGGDPSGVGTSTAAAVLAYAYSKQIVLPPAPGGATGTYKFSTDVTFPTGTELIVPCGVTLAPDAGKFVRNLGVTKAGYCTIVSGAGVVSLGRDVKADWWPSTGGDDTIAINAADRSTNNASALSFTGSISTTTLTVTAVASGYITLGKSITGAGVTANTIVTALGTGTGEVGTYTVSISQTVGSEAMTGDSADGSENIIRLGCRTHTIATAIILHANLANPQKLVGCGPNATVLSTSGGSFARGALTQAGTVAGAGNDLMSFTWRDFGIACSADQAIQGITLGTTTKAIRSYTKNVIERVKIADCRTGIGWYNTRLVDLIDMWVNVHGETTSSATAILMDFDDTSQFNGDSDIIRGQFACNLTSPSGGLGYGMRLRSEGSGTNISAIRVHGAVFYYCNKMVYGTWASTGTMGDHFFGAGLQCETCGSVADYSGNTGTKKAAMLRFDGLYLTGTAGSPNFRFAGGNTDEIVDILIHNVRLRGGGGCAGCRFASLEYTANSTITGNQLISIEGSGGNPNEIINLTASRKSTITNNTVDADGISGAVANFVTAGTSSSDVVIVGNNARGAATALLNASSVTNTCKSSNMPTTAIDANGC